MRKDPRSIPFRDLGASVLARSLAKPATVRGYRRWLDVVDPVLGSRRCGEVSRTDILDALAEARERELSPKSLANVLQVVRMVLREAGHEEVAAGVKIPQAPRQLRALGVEQAKLLREALQYRASPLDLPLAVLLGTGIRLGELLALRPCDYDRHGMRLRVAGSKTTNAARVVDVPDWLHGNLTAQTNHAAGVHQLFGEDFDPQALRRRLATLLARLGLPRIRIHDLRHTRFTCLLLSGAPLLYVSSQAGHSSPAYTMRVYGHAAAATQEERRRWCNV